MHRTFGRMNRVVLAMCVSALGLGWTGEGASGPGVAWAQAAGDAKEKLEPTRAVLRQIARLTYDVEFRADLAGARKVQATAKVVLQRHETDGTWRIVLSGEQQNTVGGRTTSQPLAATWDGKIASVLVAQRRHVRRTVPRDFETVRLDFGQGDASAVVLWDVMTQRPLEAVDVAGRLEYEGVEKVGDEECDVFWIAPAPGTTDANQGRTLATLAGVPVRLAVSVRDRLPRRIEYFPLSALRSTPANRPAPTRVQTFSAVVGHMDEAELDLTVPLPEGFKVSDGPGVREALNDRPQGPAPASGPASGPGSGPASAPPSGPASAAPPSAAAPVTYEHPLLPSDDELMRTGTQGPDFRLDGSDGKQHSLSDYPGKVVVLAFWGTWSPDSVASLDAVQRVHERFKNRGVVVLGMNFESNPSADPLKHLRDKGHTFVSLLRAQPISGRYKVRRWPTFCVLGKDHRLVWTGDGLKSPPGGSRPGADGQVAYLESNLSQAVEKALATP